MSQRCYLTWTLKTGDTSTSPDPLIASSSATGPFESAYIDKRSLKASERFTRKVKVGPGLLLIGFRLSHRTWGGCIKWNRIEPFGSQPVTPI